MPETTSLHTEIQRIYSQRLKQSGDRCGDAACGSEGILTKLADYPGEEVEQLPAEARDHSFGCGNPLAFEGIQAGDVVLDIGSGAGMDALLAASRVGPEGRVIGVDMTEAMLEQATRAAEKAGADNVEFRRGQAEGLPVDDNSVDWVISNCVLNLSPDKPAAFREIVRVLRPGGRISISDIVLQKPLPEVLVGNTEFWAACVGGAIPEADYVSGLVAAGLADVTVTDKLVYDSDVAAALLDLTAESGSLLPASLDGTLASVRVEGRKA